MIEVSHLRILQALHHNGTLREAANTLCLTQSALSHQIRYLEQKLELKLWQREGRRLRLTQAGELLLRTARQVLPLLEKTEQALRAHAEGRQGVLTIGVECYPCHEWLNGTIAHYLRDLPEVEVDIVNQFQFSGLEGLLNHHIDVLVTPDRFEQPGLRYIPLFDYELSLVVASDHRLAGRRRVEPADLAEEVLITFPVSVERLDIFSDFLHPGGVAPRQHKTIASVEIMLQLTTLGRGVCPLPGWLARRFAQSHSLATLSLGEGLHKTLFACVRQEEETTPYLARFIELGQQLADRLDDQPA